MSTVRKLLESKQDETNYSVEANDTVYRALQVMDEANIGAVLVTDRGKIVGIYTERDYLKKGELEGRTAKTTLLKEVMTDGMYTVGMDTSIDQCKALMKAHRIRHMPIVENGQLLGLVSMRDVMNLALDEKESELKGLENYILASGFAS
ncbi:MAG: CBS domain-containing protein [Pirellulales bacterium]|nr:CBS domain-containing protein [Pirellulales bacterium]